MGSIKRHNHSSSNEQIINPFLRLQQEVTHAMNDFYDLFEPKSSNLTHFDDLMISPAIDIVENKDNFKIEVEMPGMGEEDIQVSFNENRLTIQGEKTISKKDDKKDFVSREINYGRYERSISLPLTADVEKATASFKKGMLWIVIPKKSGSSKTARSIKIEKAK